MASQTERHYKKLKQRRVLVISAGGEQSGIQCLYFMERENSWEIISHAVIPYPPRIGSVLELKGQSAVTFDDMSWFECKITLLFVECAKAALTRVPRALRKPNLIVLNQPMLFKGPTGENEKFPLWNLSPGDPQFLASSLNVPVLSDLSRYSLLAGGTGSVPTWAGNFIISRRFSGNVVFLNIGLVARMTIIDRTLGRCILDSDTGPGMCLINRCAREIGCADGFDRDGSEAARGNVDGACLDQLATTPWFLQNAPKESAADLFDPLLQKPCLMALAPSDKLSTVTALTARTIYDFFRKEYREPEPPEAVILSGGGANNLSLGKFLSTYFGHCQLLSSESLGIPGEMRIPLAIGLSVDAFLTGNAVLWEGGKVPDKGAKIGRLTLP
jgi:anhydro-N-acetylmuramic acid kinase